MTLSDLQTQLERIDGKPYPAYKDLRGSYDCGQFTLSIDRVQGDPFAAPSRLSLSIDHQDSKLPASLFSNVSRRTGTENFLAIAFSNACRQTSSHLGSGKSGLLAIDTPGQEVLQRTCVEIYDTRTLVHFSAGLPANGRRIMGRAAAKLLVDAIPQIVEDALLYPNIDARELQSFADTNEDADSLRDQLEERGLVAFVADGAILPRASGIDQRPLADAVPFNSPPSLRVSIDTPHAGAVSGMGIPKGITLIVGGGYHGKSTLLNALERGVYNHRPLDGRQQVVARRDATKVRAEDGRSVAGVDLTPFINNLPGGKDTRAFSSENASGSTSQAAAIIETLETGSQLLLIDEDISATNFLIRDERMQRLIAPEKEPITPFVQRILPLYESRGVSTILVLGGSGDYFEPAHRIIALDNYLPHDLTQEAKALAAPASPTDQGVSFQVLDSHRFASGISPYKQSASYRGNHRGRSSGNRPPRKNIKTRDTATLTFGESDIDLSLISQIVDTSQVRALGAALAYAAEENLFENHSLIEALEITLDHIDQDGLSLLGENDLAEIRLQDLAAALNRLRTLKVDQRA